MSQAQAAAFSSARPEAETAISATYAAPPAPKKSDFLAAWSAQAQWNKDYTDEFLPLVEVEFTRSTGVTIRFHRDDDSPQDLVVYFCVRRNAVSTQTYLAVEAEVGPNIFTEFNTLDDVHLLSDELVEDTGKGPTEREMWEMLMDSLIASGGLISLNMLVLIKLMADRHLADCELDEFNGGPMFGTEGNGIQDDEPIGFATSSAEYLTPPDESHA